MNTSTDVDTDQAMAAVKAATLIESLPWLKRYSGRIVVVKFGGNAMIDDDLKRAFAEDMVYLRYAGVRPVVVHGGGPQISAALERRGIRSEFRGGYRVTTTAAIDVVRDVLDGQVTRELVELIGEHGPMASAAPGDRESLFSGSRRSALIDDEVVDLGHVGDIASVDPAVVLAALDRGLIPVVSSIAADERDPGQTLNVNADAAAAALAIALGAAKLVMLTDVAGLYRDWPDTASLVEQITVSELTALLPTLQSGMIPKMTACLDAIGAGVGAATIIDGRVPHAILLEIFTKRGSGTEVIPDDRRQHA